jgi:tetratricopeptide (TPR) repeat protein
MKMSFVLVLLFVPLFNWGQISDLLTPGNIQKLGNIGAAQEAESAAIFAAYGTVPYIPTAVDPTFTFSIAKEKLELYMKKWVVAPLGPADRSYKDEVSYYNKETKHSFRTIKNIVVTDHFLQFTNKEPQSASDTVTIYFKDILVSEVSYFTPLRNGISANVKVGQHVFRCRIRELPDVFYYIQQYYAAQHFPAEIISFQSTVDEYNKMIDKPEFTEEQRKYLVQANAFLEKGDYFGAIELYNKSIEMNPISYIPAYYNLALISAMADSYPYAIFNMKKYLMLAPYAEDARAAQDKIYEWEVLIQVK